MTIILKSEQIGFISLTELMRVGIISFSIRKSVTGLIDMALLLFGDGASLRIQSKVTGVESWREVGTLVLEYITASEEADSSQIASLSRSWLDIERIELMVLQEAAFSVEGGICVVNRAGEKLTILAGAFPHSIAVEAPFYVGAFEPEFDIGEYKNIGEGDKV